MVARVGDGQEAIAQAVGEEVVEHPAVVLAEHGVLGAAVRRAWSRRWRGPAAGTPRRRARSSRSRPCGRRRRRPRARARPRARPGCPRTARASPSPRTARAARRPRRGGRAGACAGGRRPSGGRTLAATGDPGRAQAAVRRVVSAMTARNVSTTAGSNCVPAQRRSSSSASSGVRAAAYGRPGGHRVEGVADGDDARAERDRVGLQAVGVALPVEALVRRAHELGDAAQRRRGADDPLADQRVAAHERPLVLAQRAGLGEDRRRGSRPCRRRAARRRGGSARPPPRAARAGARCARPARRRSRGARRGRGCARSARVSSTSLLWRPADMRPACFWAYMRWSAIRSASAGSVASCGSRIEPYEQPIEKPSPDSDSAAAAERTSCSGSSAPGSISTQNSSPPIRNALPRRSRQAARLRAEPDEQGVAGGVAEGVVVVLEAVEVEQRQHDGGAVELLDRRRQRAAVAEPGQRVGLRLVARGAQHRDVLRGRSA